MEMNVIAQEMWLWRMQQYLPGTCYNYDAGFSGETCLEPCPLLEKRYSLVYHIKKTIMVLSVSAKVISMNVRTCSECKNLGICEDCAVGWYATSYNIWLSRKLCKQCDRKTSTGNCGAYKVGWSGVTCDCKEKNWGKLLLRKLYLLKLCKWILRYGVHGWIPRKFQW
jgi:hypothetical protein